MKKGALLMALAATGAICNAEELGRVISSTPIINQVAQPRQVCSTSNVPVQPQKSGAGAVVGAIAGGAMGNAIGGGTGRAAATFLGLLGGAIVGDRIEGSGNSQLAQVQNCTTQTVYENRTTGYTVVYEYAGKQYSTLMPTDPGPYVKLQISPVSAAPAQPAPQADSSQTPYQQFPQYPQEPVAQQTIEQSYAPVYYTNQTYYQPYYQPYYRPYYPPVGVSLNLGWSSGGYYGHGHH